MEIRFLTKRESGWGGTFPPKNALGEIFATPTKTDAQN